MDYCDVNEARALSGLRLVLTAGVPGPWGEAAKGIFHVKSVPFVPVRQEAGQPNEDLKSWTGFSNAPQAVWNEERARCGWAEILLLGERLAPEPALIPEDPEGRALMFGYSHEICGEMGFGWCRRLTLMDGILSRDSGVENAGLEIVRRMGARYGYDATAAAAARGRIEQVLVLLGRRLRQQRARGRPYFVGSALTALDIYWAAFAAMLEPLPHEFCGMPDFMRTQYTLQDAELRKSADPILLEHRDLVYERHLALPLDF
jgi:glutathione S-transferase